MRVDVKVYQFFWGLFLQLNVAIAAEASTDSAASKVAEPALFRDMRRSSPSDAPTSSEHEIESQFDNTTSTNVTAQLGETAYLHCRVKQLGDRTVSWIRRRDFHILTVAHYTYTNDQRFQVTNKPFPEDWTLQIRYVQPKDTGLYECQVSSDPTISMFVILNVVVPIVEIMESPEYHTQSGSTFTLTCVVSQSPVPPKIIFWWHNDRQINYDRKPSGIPLNTTSGNKTSSTLTIKNALKTDMGNYSCSPPGDGERASVFVNVLNGEKTAAMQHEGKGRGYSRISRMPDWMFGLLLFVSTVYFGLR